MAFCFENKKQHSQRRDEQPIAQCGNDAEYIVKEGVVKRVCSDEGTGLIKIVQVNQPQQDEEEPADNKLIVFLNQAYNHDGCKNKGQGGVYKILEQEGRYGKVINGYTISHKGYNQGLLFFFN